MLTFIYLQKKALHAVGMIARNLPFDRQKEMGEFLLHSIFKEALHEGELNILENKYVLIEIKNLHFSRTFTLKDNIFKIIKHSPKADATISGDLSSFIQLAARTQDPDTLFFQRKISIQGNTELSLTLKNLIDSIDRENIPNYMFNAIQIIEKFDRFIMRPSIQR